MTSKLVARIQRVESMLQAGTRPATVFRYGRVRFLRGDAVGERHMEVLERQPTTIPNVERCEFEERLGPSRDGDELSFNVYLDLGEGIAPPSRQALVISTLPCEASANECVKKGSYDDDQSRS